jgi:transposase
MVHFVGLDVSVKETSVCIVDDAGAVILEEKVPTEPADIIALLTALGATYGRIGIEAGPLSQWLVNALTAAALPVICVETRHMKALLTAQQINKTDRNDARGIAQMMRVGLFKPVHVKTLMAQEQRMLLTSRKLLQRKLLDLECDLRGTLRNFGLKVGVVSGSRYEARVRELVAGFPRLAAIADPLLTVRRVMRQQFAVLHKMLLDTVRDDPVCRRLMTAPGVGAIVALTYRATIDQPQRFVHSRAVGAHVGLTPKRYPVRRDRLRRQGVQMRRRPAAHDALRGRTGTARPQWEMVVAEGMGHAGGSAAWAPSSHRRGRQAPGRRSAPYVGRWQRVPLEQGRRRGSCGCLSQDNCRHGDNAFCSGRKMSSRGRRVG